MNIRTVIRKYIMENIDGNKPVDNLFNYYTTRKEQEETNFNFSIPKKKYGDYVISSLTHIIMEEEGVSEKSFSQVDQVVEKAKHLVLDNPEAIKIVEECSTNNYRHNLCAEKIYAL